jgi:hypothetical protein
MSLGSRVPFRTYLFLNFPTSAPLFFLRAPITPHLYFLIWRLSHYLALLPKHFLTTPHCRSQTRRDIAKFHCTCPKKHRHNRLGHCRLGGVKASGEPVPSSSTADPVTGGIAYTYPYHCEQVLSLVMSISTPWHPSKGQ